MRANLIGVGYWGSFIYKTLKEITDTISYLNFPHIKRIKVREIIEIMAI